MKTAIDWRSKAEPWRSIGLAFAQEATEYLRDEDAGYPRV
jgi:hypothetical protein